MAPLPPLREQKMAPVDRQTLTSLLRELYGSTNGNEWERQEGYYTPILPLEKWRGVTYIEMEELRIILEDNNLSGMTMMTEMCPHPHPLSRGAA